jgi:hypothetical protein
MRELIVGLALIVAGVCGGAAWAQSAAKTVTVTGEVIDLVCYARNKSTGKDHGRALECAHACVKWEGQPVGLLTKDGHVYQLAGGLTASNNEKIAGYVAQTVTITGEVSELDGLPILTANDVKTGSTQEEQSRPKAAAKRRAAAGGM